MLDQSNLFFRMAKKIRNFQHFQKILERQEQILDFRPFKIETLMPEKALKIYKDLHKKFNESEESGWEDNSWQESQKGLFVWFMVIYTYYLNKEKAQTHPHSQQKIPIDYPRVSTVFFGKSTLFLQFQYLNLLKSSQKIIWTQYEDTLLRNATKKINNQKWTQISMEIFANTNRERFISSKMCRQRWHNHLDENKVKGNWTLEEDLAIIEYVVEAQGKKWSKMKAKLGFRRTEHMIKNRYNSLITKNKTFKNQKERVITQRLLTELREKISRQPKQKQDKQKELQSIEAEMGVCRLKVENVSSEGQEGVAEQRQEQVQKGYQGIIDQGSNKIQLNEGQPQENNLYPFSSYNYELEICNYNSQVFEFHKNQMMFYQQYIPYGQVLPTLETYLNSIEYQAALNNNEPQQEPEQDN